MLKVTRVSRTFRSGDGLVQAVDNVSFEVPTGCFASVIGTSGSGKTTLLSLLGTLDKPTDGSIELNGQAITAMSDHELISYRRQKIGFVFQGYNLIPNLTALENVMLPLLFERLPRAARKQRAEALLEQVGLEGRQIKRKPGRLSGGQQQRVAIARALANKPSLLLADEPTGNLDSETGQKIFNLLHELTRTQHTTIIAVTHDTSIAGKTDATFRMQDGKMI